ncbi:serine hydrolase domain-containing protein [Parabacteroides pacaensis]|uniref:serine hydrolase domain-containing protein n=1 Tax=Parabacteroides pacaensis TaxID=2086575 RepID=UPI000D0F3C51|nr:serine hydrolase [Parabacteroides pacaensis]
MKKAGWVTGIVCGLLVGFLAWPSNFYLRQAFIHFLPDIDDYKHFESRIVKANDPHPWKLASSYNTLHLSPGHLPVFEKLGTVAFVVIQDSAILFEQYWEGYDNRSLSNSFSMAKSILSLAIGCAIEDGFIKNTEQPVSDFFPQFKGYNGKVLTLRHLLTMSAGMDFDEAYSSPFSATTKYYYGNNLDKLVFDMKEIAEPGVRFNYQSGVSQLLAFILEKATGESLSRYVSRKLWTPMQAEEDALWSLDRKGGIEKAYCCFNSNARDFARFGQLLLNKGKWNGKQIVPESYLAEATRPASWLQSAYDDGANQLYGYQFWTLQYQGMKIPYFRGILGQYIFVIPEKNAVIVRLGHKRSENRTEQHYTEDIDTWLQAGLEMLP